MAARRGFVHPIGSPVVIEQLQIAVPDPLGLAADCRRDLGMEFQLIGDVAVSPVGRQVIRLVGGGGEPSLVIGAGVGEARTVTALGMCFEIVPATLPAPVYILKTPKRVSGISAFSAALIPSASTRRVSIGSITPSSHSRAVE